MRGATMLGAALLATGLLAAAPVGAAAQGQAISSPDQSARSSGYEAGYRAGQSDLRSGTPYDFRGKNDYQQGELGYREGMGLDREQYAWDFRSGFERGYDDSFNRLSDDPLAERDCHYHEPFGDGAGYSAAGNPAGDVGAHDYVPGYVREGTAIQLTLNNSLSTRTSLAGDSFSATVSAPVYDRDGQQVVIPAGAEVEGHVVSVRPGGSVGGTADLQLAFDRIHLPDGNSEQMSAGVSSVGAGGAGAAVRGVPVPNGEGGVEQSRSRESVGSATAGGAVGAVVGGLLGGGKGAGVGAVAGAGLGLAVSAQGAALDLRAGTPLTITLNQPLDVQ